MHKYVPFARGKHKLDNETGWVSALHQSGHLVDALLDHHTLRSQHTHKEKGSFKSLGEPCRNEVEYHCTRCRSSFYIRFDQNLDVHHWCEDLHPSPYMAISGQQHQSFGDFCSWFWTCTVCPIAFVLTRIHRKYRTISCEDLQRSILCGKTGYADLCTDSDRCLGCSYKIGRI